MIYNFMSVKCTHYKLCSVELKLMYFSQFWGMKHFYQFVTYDNSSGVSHSGVSSSRGVSHSGVS